MLSIVLPVYNSDSFLIECMESIFNQSYKNFELIIINDNSNDRSSEIIDFYKQRYKKKIKIINNKNQLGVARSLNKGIKKSIGKYIVRLDADDICFHNRLEYLSKYMNSHPNVDILFTGMKYLNSHNKLINKIGIDIENKEIGSLINFFNPLNHPTMIARKKVFLNYKYPLDYNGFEDWKLWIRLHSDGFKLKSISKVLYKYRIHKYQVSKKINLNNFFEIINNNLKNNLKLDYTKNNLNNLSFEELKLVLENYFNKYIVEFRIKKLIMIYFILLYFKKTPYSLLKQIVKTFGLRSFNILFHIFICLISRKSILN